MVLDSGEITKRFGRVRVMESEESEESGDIDGCECELRGDGK